MKKQFLALIILFLLTGIIGCGNLSKETIENIELIKSLMKNPITEKSFTPSGTSTDYYEIKLDDCFLNLYTKTYDAGELYITKSIEVPLSDLNPNSVESKRNIFSTNGGYYIEIHCKDEKKSIKEDWRRVDENFAKKQIETNNVLIISFNSKADSDSAKKAFEFLINNCSK